MDGHFFLDKEGPYKTLNDLWDGERSSHIQTRCIHNRSSCVSRNRSSCVSRHCSSFMGRWVVCMFCCLVRA